MVVDSFVVGDQQFIFQVNSYVVCEGDLEGFRLGDSVMEGFFSRICGVVIVRRGDDVNFVIFVIDGIFFEFNCVVSKVLVV